MSTPETPTLRILSLEDSPFDAELIERELRVGGVSFVSQRVQNGGEFEQSIADFRPDLILADFKLPSFDGTQALAIAHQKCPDVPFIVISGAVGEETAVELLKSGATDFVLKDRLGRLVPAVLRALREVAERNARRRAEADLRTLNEELEARVADRTRQLRESNTLMEEDLNMARELQMAFLPQVFPTLPRGSAPSSSSVKFFSLYRPTNRVSGDFFNVVRLSDTSVGVFICDVMGHGVRAALVTAMMRTLEEQLSEAASDPGALLTQINQALCMILRQSGTTLFTTACYIIADVATAQIRFANAGHPSPLLVHRERGAVESITARGNSGPALGLFEDVQYQTHERTVATDDLVLLFTDGLFEVENKSDEPFGEERLRETIRQHAGMSPDQTILDTFAEIKDFAQGRAFTDDVCLVGLEIAHLQPPKG
jgi:sigma-B regulation protein RsbU (phosphoserine phosphatase)